MPLSLRQTLSDFSQQSLWIYVGGVADLNIEHVGKCLFVHNKSTLIDILKSTSLICDTQFYLPAMQLQWTVIISPVYLKPTHAVCYPAMQLQRTVIIYPVYLKPTHAVCALSGEFLLGFTFAIKMQQFPKGQILTVLMCPLLRPLTLGKRFLLFLPDSHSAYYDSSVSALGRSLPPSLGLSRICCTWSSFWWKRWVGGWWVHPPALATLALGTSVGFLSIGRSD